MRQKFWYFKTEQSGSGHVYVRKISQDEYYNPNNKLAADLELPGTAAAIGKVRFLPERTEP